MSIIFDALKRADAQRQKGQAPKLASTRTSLRTHSKARLWALVSLCLILGLSAWWFRRGSIDSGEIIAATEVAKPRTISREVAVAAGESTPAPRVPQADLSLKETPAVPQNLVVATDLSAAELNASGGRRLSVPSLDSPLTGAAQFDKRPEPIVAVAPPVAPVSAKPVEPLLVKPVPTAALSEPKPSEVIATPAPVAAIAPPVIAAPEPALPSIFELDYKVRHELPKMAVSMYVYNTQQQNSFVIIAGKSYKEGEQIESKVSITKIRADGIECNFQGTRFFYPRQSL